jgi:hypothetical protein
MAGFSNAEPLEEFKHRLNSLTEKTKQDHQKLIAFLEDPFLKIYSDDPNLPYKTTKLKAIYTKNAAKQFWL